LGAPLRPDGHYAASKRQENQGGAEDHQGTGKGAHSQPGQLGEKGDTGRGGTLEEGRRSRRGRQDPRPLDEARRRSLRVGRQDAQARTGETAQTSDVPGEGNEALRSPGNPRGPQTERRAGEEAQGGPPEVDRVLRGGAQGRADQPERSPGD